jgi:hypothetical protein
MLSLARRLKRYVIASYPPLTFVSVMAWAYGESGLFTAYDPRVPHWRPGISTLITAVTVAINMLIMRAADDIRDIDYDRRYNPGRPVASGAVKTGDLVIMSGIGTILILMLNAGDVLAQVVLLVQFTYATAAMAAYYRWRRPSGDNLLTGLAVSIPVPLMVQIYMYARYLHETALSATSSGALVILTVTLARLHTEIARKIMLRPSPSERTYVHNFGFAGAVAVALGAVAASVLLLLLSAPWPWAFLGVLPLWWVVNPLWQLWCGTEKRWARSAPFWFLLSTFVAYILIAVMA